ncbi:MAG: 2-amino-4-hydroxy-6-hydroxymethyldihydropteridine diphosphokinase [Cyclobacteriaceae bacterium]
MNGIFILLGSNIGDSISMLTRALVCIQTQAGSVVKCSKLYRTKAWGYENQPDFLNQVIEIQTDFSPSELLEKLLNIELQLGRVRMEKWHERSIDIDILYYNSMSINDENLKIPHPLIAIRRFVLAPMAEIAPDFIHPVNGLSQLEMLNVCPDPLEVAAIEPEIGDKNTKYK